MTENYIEPPKITSREPKLEDIDSLRSILERSLIDSETGSPITEEIQSTLDRVTGFISDEETPFRYLIAQSADGTIIGMMGLTRPDEEMSAYANDPAAAVELVNAFVDPEIRKSGAGKKLVEDLLTQARANGAKEVVVNSGPRYRETGWAFWARVMSDVKDEERKGYGETALLKDRYGEGLDAMVWRKDIA